jgi:hypothetical protein
LTNGSHGDRLAGTSSPLSSKEPEKRSIAVAAMWGRVRRSNYQWDVASFGSRKFMKIIDQPTQGSGGLFPGVVLKLSTDSVSRWYSERSYHADEQCQNECEIGHC